MHEILDKILSNINTWLHFAEAKNGIMITLNGAAIYGLLGLMNSDTAMLTIYRPAYIVVIVAAVISAIICMVSFTPKLAIPYIKTSRKTDPNLLFFADIAGLSVKEYLEKLHRRYAGVLNSQVHSKEYESDLAEQIIANSRIAVAKYRYFRLALGFSMTGVIVASIVALIISRRDLF